MLTIYCDGSHRNGRVGWGFLVVENHSRIVYQASGEVKNQNAKKQKSVAGELAAVMEAIEWLKRNNKKAEIAVDYILPVQLWEGKAKIFRNFTTTFFSEYFKLNKNRIIRIYKVDAHGAYKFQNIVDKIARKVVEPYNFSCSSASIYDRMLS